MLFKTFQDMRPFQERRQKLNELAPDSVFILFSGEEAHLTNFRANSSFVYLTGFEEPQAIAVIRTGKHHKFTLFVREKNPEVEVWDGERYGPVRAQKEFGADQCFGLSEAEEQLPQLIRGAERIFFAIGDEVAFDEMILQARDRAQQLDRRAGVPKITLSDPNKVLAPMRMVKDAAEIAFLKESCELSAQAHIHVMKNVKPQMNERQALGHLLFSFYQAEATREGYSSILASGPNACTLHYRDNRRTMLDGDFLLIDAGAEKNYFTADITRTYPVNGKYTEPQRKIYQAVLDVQKQLIDAVAPGFSLPQLQELSIELLTQKMIDLGLLRGSVEENIKSKAYHKYYPHGVGHYLGMDVHDIGPSKNGDQPVPFVPGVVVTVEPGIYVPEGDDQAPEGLRGLGVRIEDDVLVTSTGREVLTATAPKEISDIESLMQT